MGGVNKKKAGKNKGGKGGEKPKRSTPPHKEVRRALSACSPSSALHPCSQCGFNSKFCTSTGRIPTEHQLNLLGASGGVYIIEQAMHCSTCAGLRFLGVAAAHYIVRRKACGHMRLHWHA